MRMCNHIVSFDNVKVLASSKTTFHLKIKTKNILISHNQRILNKNGTSLKLCLFVQLQSHIAIINIRKW